MSVAIETGKTFFNALLIYESTEDHITLLNGSLAYGPPLSQSALFPMLDPPAPTESSTPPVFALATPTQTASAMPDEWMVWTWRDISGKLQASHLETNHLQFAAPFSFDSKGNALFAAKYANGSYSNEALSTIFDNSTVFGEPSDDSLSSSLAKSTGITTCAYSYLRRSETVVANIRSSLL